MGNKIEVADIFLLYGHLLGPLSKQKERIIRNIIECRTELLGGHIYRCDKCGHEEHVFRSCQDRHCPKCQAKARKKWVEARMKEVLPVAYYHVTITMSHVFNELILTNKQIIYKLMFETSSAAVLELFAEQYEGAKAGIIAVLHTWGQNLGLHPHIHMVIPAGGLADNDTRWVKCKSGKKSKKNYFLPVDVLGKLFRAKFVAGLKRLFYSGKLTFLDVNKHLDYPGTFQDLLDSAFKTPWIANAKDPFNSTLAVLKYLGGYTHRIAISNYRIKSLENDMVTFSYKDYRQKGKKGRSYTWKVMSLHVVEFMRRFLLHVVPRRFSRIRYYGFLSSKLKKKAIERARKILEETKQGIVCAAKLAKTLKEFETDGFVTSDICKSCEEGVMIIVATISGTRGKEVAFLPLRPT